MRTIILTALLLSGSFLCAYGQNFREDFFQIINTDDTVAAEKIVNEWRKEKPGDPELYVALFNLYTRKSMVNVIEMGQDPKGEDVLEVMDQDSTVRKPVAFIYDGTYFKPDVLKIAYAYIDTGIAKFPTRLDMRFGKVYMLIETKDHENFTKEMIATIDYFGKTKCVWTWATGVPVEGGSKQAMLSTIQHYITLLYDAEDEKLLENMKRISEAVLKYFPNEVEFLSNVSIVYMLKKDYDKALKLLLKAEKKAPEDYIILGNIAHCYYEKKDTKKAIKYYELTEKYGDESMKEFARTKINELKTK